MKTWKGSLLVKALLAALILHCSLPASAQLKLLVCSNPVGILSYDGTTGAYLGVFAPPGQNNLGDAHYMKIGPDGLLYVGTGQSSGVVRFNATTGTFVDAFVPAGYGGLTNAYGIQFASNGDLLVNSGLTNKVLRYNGSTGASMGAFATSGLSLPHGSTFGPDGNLYVSNWSANSVSRYDGATGAFISTFVPGGSGGLSGPQGITFGADGNLYVAGGASHNVLKYNGSTGAFISAFVPSGSGGLSKPEAIAFGPDGNLYVANYNGHSINRYDGTTGAFIDAFVTAGSGGLQYPVGLIFVNAGALTVSTLQLAATQTTGGKSVRGTVYLTSAAPAGGFEVTLSSDKPSAIVPATITVPEGSANASFTIKTTSVAASTKAVISASGGGVTAKKTLTIKPNTPKALLLSADSVSSGDALIGTVVLEVPAGPGGVVVAISADNAAAQLGATSITIPEGQASGSFSVTAGTVSSVTTVNVSAKANGTTKKDVLTICP